MPCHSSHKQILGDARAADLPLRPCVPCSSTAETLVEILKPCKNPARTVLDTEDLSSASFGRDLDRRLGARRQPIQQRRATSPGSPTPFNSLASLD
jgi:hypothetical protein